MQVSFGVSAYDSNDFGLPTVELENFYPEVLPQLGQARLYPTPGLTLFAASANAVRGVFQADGALSGEIVYADGGDIKRVDSGGTVSAVGTAATDDYRAQFATSYAHLVAVSGGSAYVVNASSLTAITVSNAGSLTGLATINQRHLYTDSEYLWWSDVADPQTVQATAFAAPEQEPDALLGVAVHRGRVWLLGKQTMEMWTPTAASDVANAFAFTGYTAPNGVIGRDAHCLTDDALFVVAPSGQVFRMDGTQRTRISTGDIERRIKSLSAANQEKVRLSSYQWNGHEFVRVTLPSAGSWNYDLATGAWHRARSLGAETHIADDYVMAFGSTYAAGAGGIYSLSSTVYTEGGEYVRRVAQALIPVEDGRPNLDRLTVRTSTVGIPGTGQGSEPKLLLRYARDGVVFGNEIERTAPISGVYSTGVSWGPLGHLKPPVCKIEVAYSDPVGLTLSNVELNRSRP
ncbi:MAG: packaged DNA stabilization protein gp10 [Epibacterium sp.]|nr:packaged DNA stabilization protein gp10 [Epibacterium sp.]NQX73930.1 hypothetical protein [Epibacterium sp.]